MEHRPESNFGDQVFGGIVSVSMECDDGLAMKEPGTITSFNAFSLTLSEKKYPPSLL